MYYSIKFKRYKRVYSDYKRPSLTSVPGPSTLFDSDTSRDILYVCNLVNFQIIFTIRKKKESC